MRAARMAASCGAKAAIAEEYRLAGTCVIRGCVPKKLFVLTSRFADRFDIAQNFGCSVTARFDWTTLLANKDKELARLEAADVAVLEEPAWKSFAIAPPWWAQTWQTLIERPARAEFSLPPVHGH